jgi:hypothetical protein
MDVMYAFNEGTNARIYSGLQQLLENLIKYNNNMLMNLKTSTYVV